MLSQKGIEKLCAPIKFCLYVDGDRMFGGGPQFPASMSQPFQGTPMNNGPVGSKGPRGNYKANNVLLSNTTQERLIANLSSLTINANKVRAVMLWMLTNPIMRSRSNATNVCLVYYMML